MREFLFFTRLSIDSWAPRRTDFSLLFSVLSDEPLSRDELEQLRMQLNNAVAVCIDQGEAHLLFCW